MLKSHGVVARIVRRISAGSNSSQQLQSQNVWGIAAFGSLPTCAMEVTKASPVTGPPFVFFVVVLVIIIVFLTKFLRSSSSFNGIFATVDERERFYARLSRSRTVLLAALPVPLALLAVNYLAVPTSVKNSGERYSVFEAALPILLSINKDTSMIAKSTSNIEEAIENTSATAIEIEKNTGDAAVKLDELAGDLEIQTNTFLSAVLNDDPDKARSLLVSPDSRRIVATFLQAADANGRLGIEYIAERFRSERHKEALQQMFGHNNFEAAVPIIDRSQVKRQALWYALKYSNPEMTRVLIENGAPPYPAQTFIGRDDAELMTETFFPLEWLANNDGGTAQEQADIAKILKQDGFDQLSDDSRTKLIGLGVPLVEWSRELVTSCKRRLPSICEQAAPEQQERFCSGLMRIPRKMKIKWDFQSDEEVDLYLRYMTHLPDRIFIEGYLDVPDSWSIQRSYIFEAAMDGESFIQIEYNDSGCYNPNYGSALRCWRHQGLGFRFDHAAKAWKPHPKSTFSAGRIAREVECR